jgi:hypothetical protein
MSRSVFLVIVICFTCLYNSFIFSRNVTYRKHNLSSELVQSDVLKPHHVHECPPVQSCECSHSLANDSFLIPFFDTPVTTQATTGTTFIMKKTRQFIMPVNLQSIPPLQNNAYPISNKWVVVTTIFPPTNTIRGLCQLRDWCTVIVADTKSLSTEEYAIQLGIPNCCVVYLSLHSQAALGYSILEHIPNNSFGRKNIGYMFAMQQGAEAIYDTDDDNEISNQFILESWANNNKNDFNWIMVGSNPYPAFGVSNIWPRGLPLDQIKNSSSYSQYSQTLFPLDSVCVVQSLANQEPDVDAIYRLTNFNYPLTFQSALTACQIHPDWIAPFNAQATLFFKDAFPYMLLPVTVHGRVSDIWRSYFAQAVMKCPLVFSSPWVTQIRNSHNYLADFQSELPLYTQATSLVTHLTYNKFQSLSEAFIDAYEHEILEYSDVELALAWERDMKRIHFNASTSKKRTVQFTHLFIAMGRGMHLREWKDRIMIDPNLLHVDVLLGVFDEPVESLQCEEHTRVICISVHGTTWTSGRNLLAKIAYKRELETNIRYSYWTFADADILLSCFVDNTQNVQVNSNCFSVYDQFLQRTMLPITFLMEYGQFGHSSDSFISQIEAFDACFNSFHRDSIPVLFPYRADQDAVTWWSSQAIFWYRIQCFAPFFAASPLNVFASNPDHNPYPRNPRDKQEEQRIGMESMGILASILPPAPDDYPAQFSSEKIRSIDGNSNNQWQQKTINDVYRKCLGEFSANFTKFMLSV